MERKSKSVDKKTTKIGNGILKKQSLLNNNNIVKNLNERPKRGGVVKLTSRRRASPPGAPVEGSNLPQGCTPLMYACQQADEKLVAEILRKEPSSVLKRDRTLKTALHYCFDNPTAATADRIVMAAPVLLEARDQDGFTPLHLAVIQGNMPLVTFLLANNADVMALDNEKHSVVHWATVCGELEALRAVLSAGADPSTADIHGGYPLHYAAQMCGGANTGTGGGSARLSLEVLSTLLRAATRVDVLDGQGRQPLLWAASAGSAPAILALVKAGAAVEAADKDGLTALHCAASRGHTECIEMLLTLCGARPDIIDSNGCTALHYAVTLGHADATALLLNHGSDPNRQDRKGRTPAHCGCAKGQLETVRMLGTQGANIWLRNAKGDLPLHEAVASGRRDLVKWLLEMRPSQINATNNDGRTMLHIAANTDNTDLCKILLDFGGEVNAVLRTSKNILMTPLDCALHKGFRSTAKYLQMHGGLPASRLASKHVLINQETVPQLPVRHIKSTKINLKNNIAIERREIFEMSPSGTPKHKKSVKMNSSIDSSENTSDDSDGGRKKYYEERNKVKKMQKKKVKDDQNSFSDGFENKVKKKKRSSRQQKFLSDSENSEHIIIKKNKRSQSEPTQDIYNNKIVSDAPNLLANETKTGSMEKEDAKKLKNKQKTGLHKNVSRTNSPDSINLSKKVKGIDTALYEVSEIQIEKVKNGESKVNDILERIENNIEKLDSVIESRFSDNDINGSFIQTTLVTEAQVHVENNANFDKNFNEKAIMEITAVDNKNIAEGKTDRITKDNQGSESVSNKKLSTLMEHHAEINEERIDGEIIDDILHVPSHDSIIAIIPDNTILDLKAEGSSVDHMDGEHETTNDETKGDYVQAIIGILPDDEQNIQILDEESKHDAVEDSNSREVCDVMGEIVQNRETDEVKSQIEKNEDLSIVYQYDNQTLNIPVLKQYQQPLIQQSSEELTVNSDLSLKENIIDEENKTIFKSDPKDINAEAISSDKGIQKIYPITPSDNWKTNNQLSDEIQTLVGKELYETESYKILADSSNTNSADTNDKQDAFNIIKSEENEIDEPDRFIKQARYTRRRMPSMSDNEIYNVIDSSGGIRRKRLKKKYRDKNRSSMMRSKSQNSERDYESSFFVDSGLEPSPRFVYRNRIMSPRLVAYYKDRNASGNLNDTQTRIPKRKPGDKNAVDMTTVTQSVQTNMRRFFLERKIFQHLMELKRIQIRTSKANEAVLVKRAVDDYHKSSLAYVGVGRYTSNDYTFKSFEKFLYESLRRLQKSGIRNLMNMPERAFPDFDIKNKENTYKMNGLPDNPVLCTNKTHRCFHAVHAYTGIPCAAYIPAKLNHHTMPKPSVKKRSSFLPQINNKAGKQSNSQVTLELCHGNEKQMISLPAEKLDKNKRYYVTFTVKGSNQNSDSESKQLEDSHRNVKSV